MKQFLEQEVFALSPNAEGANDDTDLKVGPCNMAAGASTKSAALHEDSEYMAGLQRKLASLERDPGGVDVEAVNAIPLWARHKNGKRSAERLALYVLLGMTALVVAIMCSAVVSRVVAKILL